MENKSLYVATWITDDGSSEFYPFVDNKGRNEHDLSFDFLEYYAKEMGLENEHNFALNELRISAMHEVFDIKEPQRYVIGLNK